MSIGKPVIETVQLRIGYRQRGAETTVQSGIDLSLKSATLTGLIGENGIGKSTLLRTLSGLQPPLDGQLLLFGKPIDQHLPQDKAQLLSIVLTEKLAAANLTVYELVALGRQPYTNWLGRLSDKDREIIDRCIAQTGIGDLKERKQHEISDGQLQKVMITRALAQDTPVILLDEPTTHLDLVHKLKLLQMLKELSVEHGKCVLFSTHDIELALRYCDQLIAVTHQGVRQAAANTMVADGSLNRLFADNSVVFDPESKRFGLKDL